MYSATSISNMKGEAESAEVNLMGMIKTVSCVVPLMVERDQGHFIGLSSVADELLSAEAPSYHASLFFVNSADAIPRFLSAQNLQEL